MTTDRRLLAGRYELGEVLGYGGMAEVFRGVDVRLGRDVAVKVLRADLARDPAFLARFRREAQAAASLNHPAVVSVYDTGDDNGTPYIVMEYVEGRTLRDVLRSEGRLLPRRAMEITSAVCGALEYSHRAGIVHRDIKPGNVMLTPAGDVKVMDFGIARAVAAASSTVTQTAAVLGTAQYLSPEQARGEVVDARSDVYSAGCLLYELLTGTPPFQGDSPVAVAYQHVREDPALPSSLDPDLPPDVDAVVMKALAKNPANRYQSAGEFRGDLDRAAAGRRVEATPILAPLLPGETTRITSGAESTALLPPVGQERRESRRWPVYALLLLLVLAVLAGAGYLAKTLISSAKGSVRTPTVIGVRLAKAERSIRAAGLKVGTITYYYRGQNHNTQPNGFVFSQSPFPRASANKGSAVNLLVSKGTHLVSVPSLSGLTVGQASALLTKDDLKLGAQHVVDQPTSPPGKIFAQTPTAGTTVRSGAAVSVTYASGQVQVPGVVGETASSAEATLHGLSLKYTIRQVPTSDPAKVGFVLAQSPVGGTSVTVGTVIVLDVGEQTSSPPPSSSPPSTSTSPSSTPSP